MFWIVLGAFLAGFLFGVIVMAVLAVARECGSKKQADFSESLTTAVPPGETGEDIRSDLYRRL